VVDYEIQIMEGVEQERAEGNSQSIKVVQLISSYLYVG
jgi:hypothetical protein